jgi:hypothetical protein
VPDNEIIAVDFAISPAAWAEIDHIRALYDQDASDKADVPMIAWSIHQPSAGPQTEGVLIGFYRQSERSGIQHGIQTVAGREIVYFVNKETALKFSGKIVDFDARRGFYLT